MTQLSTFSGTVFTDSNDDGLVDGADTGLGGVTVQLLNGDGTPTGLTTTTAANGSYSFTNLAPGTYSARVLLPSTPSGATFSPYGSTTPPQPTGGAVSAEQNLLTNGSFETAGANTTALGYAGWTSSTNTAMTPFGSGPGDGPEIAITNGSSAYAIDPQNQTNPYAGVVAPDSADPNYLGGSGTHAAFFVDDGAIESISQTVKLTAGQTYEVGFDLLETTPGQNNPGFFSLSAAIGGQTITTAGSTSGTKLTPGVWTHFADLFTPTTTGTFTLTFSYASGVPGSSLASKDVLVDDVYVVPGQVTANLTTTSEVNAQGVTAPVTLGAGQSVGNESAGIYLPPATISGTVFTDANADGVKQTGDAGLSGRTVNLATGGVITATTVTDASGNYSFTNQAAGTYTVTVVAPSGDHFSSVGSSSTQTNSTVGSGGTQTVTVSNGGSATVNAGVYAPATIKGTIFTDANGDGVEQATDSGLGGVTVKLLGAGGSVVATTTTAASGAYSFTGQTPGSYTVQVVTPSGDGVSPNGTSTTLTDSTVGTGASQAVTVASGGSATVNAGLYAPSSISGTVFSDANADGVAAGGRRRAGRPDRRAARRRRPGHRHHHDGRQRRLQLHRRRARQRQHPGGAAVRRPLLPVRQQHEPARQYRQRQRQQPGDGQFRQQQRGERGCLRPGQRQRHRVRRRQWRRRAASRRRRCRRADRDPGGRQRRQRQHRDRRERRLQLRRPDPRQLHGGDHRPRR